MISDIIDNSSDLTELRGFIDEGELESIVESLIDDSNVNPENVEEVVIKNNDDFDVLGEIDSDDFEIVKTDNEEDNNEEDNNTTLTNETNDETLDEDSDNIVNENDGNISDDVENLTFEEYFDERSEESSEVEEEEQTKDRKDLQMDDDYTVENTMEEENDKVEYDDTTDDKDNEIKNDSNNDKKDDAVETRGYSYVSHLTSVLLPIITPLISIILYYAGVVKRNTKEESLTVLTTQLIILFYLALGLAVLIISKDLFIIYGVYDIVFKGFILFILVHHIVITVSASYNSYKQQFKNTIEYVV